MQPLTPRQQEVLDAIHALAVRHGHPPTLAEIAAALGFRDASSAQHFVDVLAAKGALQKEPGKRRALRLLAPPAALAGAEPGTLLLPLVGRVAAGRPILAAAHVERQVRVDSRLFQPRADYLLRVVGDSMSGIGILSGDLVAVHRASEARSGQVVVARLGEEVTVKRFLRIGDRVVLQAENPAYAPIELGPGDELAIEGVYVGCLRVA